MVTKQIEWDVQMPGWQMLEHLKKKESEQMLLKILKN